MVTRCLQTDDCSTVIYLMGRGHSGSTILSALLSQHPDITDVGELIYPMDKLCGCGRNFEECEFWRDVRMNFDTSYGMTWEQGLSLLRYQAHFLRFVPYMFLPVRNVAFHQVEMATRIVNDAILSVGKTRFLLDSSKQPARALLFVRAKYPIKIVHIVRAPEGYLSSYLRRMKKGRIRFLRRTISSGPFDFFVMIMVVLSWLIANLQCEYVRLLSPKSVIRIRYEDVMHDPMHELSRLESFLNMDLQVVRDAIAENSTMKVAHVIGGNDGVRAVNGFVFEPQKNPNYALPLYFRAIVTLITEPLKRRYGYAE